MCLLQCVCVLMQIISFQTQRNVRIYDLVKQEMIKKLLSNSQWISTMAIHPGKLSFKYLSFLNIYIYIL